MEHEEPVTTTIAETENYLAWRADEPDGESTYHLELNNVTLHFFKEEWQEFLKLAEIVVDECLERHVLGRAGDVRDEPMEIVDDGAADHLCQRPVIPLIRAFECAEVLPSLFLEDDRGRPPEPDE